MYDLNVYINIQINVKHYTTMNKLFSVLIEAKNTVKSFTIQVSQILLNLYVAN